MKKILSGLILTTLLLSSCAHTTPAQTTDDTTVSIIAYASETTAEVVLTTEDDTTTETPSTEANVETVAVVETTELTHQTEAASSKLPSGRATNIILIYPMGTYNGRVEQPFNDVWINNAEYSAESRILYDCEFEFITETLVKIWNDSPDSCVYVPISRIMHITMGGGYTGKDSWNEE